MLFFFAGQLALYIYPKIIRVKRRKKKQVVRKLYKLPQNKTKTIQIEKKNTKNKW